MDGNCKLKKTITEAFEEAALALGGVAAAYQMPDEAVWDLARSLDLIHQRACEKFQTEEEGPADEREDAVHPAIVHLLARLGGGRMVGHRERR